MDAKELAALGRKRLAKFQKKKELDDDAGEAGDLIGQLAAKSDAVEALLASLEDAKADAAGLRARLDAAEAAAAAQHAENERRAEAAAAAAASEAQARAQAEQRALGLAAALAEKEAALAAAAAAGDAKARAMEMAKFDLGACAEKLAAADKRAADLLADNKALIDQLKELRQAQVALQNEKIALYVELDTATRAVAKLTTEVQSLEALKEETEMLKEVIRTGNSVAASATAVAPTTTTPVSLPPQPPSPPISVKDATIQASETVSHVASSTEPEVFNNNTSNEINSLPIPNPLADEVEALKREIQLTRQALSEERHRTELLAMELECIPDYIQLYHNERKLLINKVTADAATPAANSSGNPIKLTDLSHIPAPKLPRAVKNVLGIDRNVACGPCADCSSRVFVL